MHGAPRRRSAYWPNIANNPPCSRSWRQPDTAGQPSRRAPKHRCSHAALEPTSVERSSRQASARLAHSTSTHAQRGAHLKEALADVEAAAHHDGHLHPAHAAQGGLQQGQLRGRYLRRNSRGGVWVAQVSFRCLSIGTTARERTTGAATVGTMACCSFAACDRLHAGSTLIGAHAAPRLQCCRQQRAARALKRRTSGKEAGGWRLLLDTRSHKRGAQARPVAPGGAAGCYESM
jgi:hypothetical protein